MYSKIIDNMYVGSIYDAITYAHEFNLIITVMEAIEMTNEERFDFLCVAKTPILYIPVLKTEYDTSVIANSETDVQDAKDEYLDPVKTEYIVSIMQDAFRRGGLKVLVHCAAGQERSPLVFVWYLHRTYKWDIDECIRYVKAKRPTMIPHPDWLKKVKENGY